MTKRIILAGGPGTGKSSVINVLAKNFPCMQESFREHLARERANKTGVDFKNTPLEFSYFLFQSRLLQHEEGEKFEFCFYDRSLWDVIIYLDHQKTEYPEDWKTEIKEKEYHSEVFYFPIWDDIYTKDDLRVESLEEAKELDLALREGYKNAGFRLIEVPTGEIKDRADFIIQKCQLLNTKL
jgi:predicted ATPase